MKKKETKYYECENGCGKSDNPKLCSRCEGKSSFFISVNGSEIGLVVVHKLLKDIHSSDVKMVLRHFANCLYKEFGMEQDVKKCLGIKQVI